MCAQRSKLKREEKRDGEWKSRSEEEKKCGVVVLTTDCVGKMEGCCESSVTVLDDNMILSDDSR